MEVGMERHSLKQIIILVWPSSAESLIVVMLKSLADFASETKITCWVGGIKRYIFYRIKKILSISRIGKIRIILGITQQRIRRRIWIWRPGCHVFGKRRILRSHQYLARRRIDGGNILSISRSR